VLVVPQPTTCRTSRLESNVDVNRDTPAKTYHDIDIDVTIAHNVNGYEICDEATGYLRKLTVHAHSS